MITISWFGLALAQSRQNDDPKATLPNLTTNSGNDSRIRRPPPLIRQPQRPPQAAEGYASPAVPDVDVVEDYVPYQGENQETFDWMLAQVSEICSVFFEFYLDVALYDHRNIWKNG